MDQQSSAKGKLPYATETSFLIPRKPLENSERLAPAYHESMAADCASAPQSFSGESVSNAVDKLQLGNKQLAHETQAQAQALRSKNEHAMPRRSSNSLEQKVGRTSIQTEHVAAYLPSSSFPNKALPATYVQTDSNGESLSDGNSNTDDDDMEIEILAFTVKRADQAYAEADWARAEDYIQTIVGMLRGGTNNMVENNISEAQWILRLVRAQIEQKKWTEALTAMLSIPKSATNPGGLFESWYALIYLNLGDLLNAEQYCKRTIKIRRKEAHPELEDSVRLMIRILIKAGETVKVEFYQSLLDSLGIYPPNRGKDSEDAKKRLAVLNLSLGSDRKTIVGKQYDLRKAVNKVIQDKDWETATILFEDEAVRKLKMRDDNPKERPLHIAARDGAMEAVAILLDKGADINSQDIDGSTPLGFATYYGKMEVVVLLLDKGANVEIENTTGQTALLSTCDTGNIEIIALLLDRGAYINTKDIYNHAPLSFACVAGNTEVVALLLDRGAYIHSMDIYGQTALHRACFAGNIEVVALLLARGAWKKSRNLKGQKPRDLALLHQHHDIVQLLQTKL